MKVHKLTKLLCVDDDIVFRFALKNTLSANGFTVAEASCDDAVDIALRFDPDLVILDVPAYPGLRKGDVYSQFKMLPELSHVPIIAITEDGSEKHIKRLLKFGIVGVIPKPLNLDKVCCAVGIIWNHYQDSFAQFMYNLLARDVDKKD